MQVDERVHSYIDIPAHAFEPASKVAARKLLVSYIGGQPILRSADPAGYLMPDLDPAAWTAWAVGTVKPESAGIDIDNASIAFQLPATGGPSEPIRQMVQTGGIVFVIASYPLPFGEDETDLPWPYAEPYRFDEPTDPATDIKGSRARQPLSLFDPQPRADPAARLTERTLEPEGLRADATIAEIAARVAARSGLKDRELALLFRVTRETFQRWRTGALRNPTPANRRQLGLLLRLLEDLDQREIKADQWLLNVSQIDDLTPYELLVRGRLDDVERLAAMLPSKSAPRDSTGADGLPVTRADTLPAFAPHGEELPDDLRPREDDGDWIEIEARGQRR